jgi:tight adherence protein B
VTPAGLLLVVAGLLIAGGAVTAVAACRGAGTRPTSHAGLAPGRPRLARLRISRLQLAGAGVGVLVLLVSGWPVAAIAAAAGVVFVPQVLGGATAARRGIARSEALADWTRRLADLIASGAASSTEQALRRSLASAPEPIAPAVANLVSRLGPQGAERALRAFATEVDDPSADKIAMVLILRERNGGPGLADVLVGLADDLNDRSRMVREVEAERAKPRSNMRTIVVVTFLLVAGMILFARTFLAVYSTALGQLALLPVVGLFGLSLRWMRRLSDPDKPSRVLVDPAPDTHALIESGPVESGLVDAVRVESGAER